MKSNKLWVCLFIATVLLRDFNTLAKKKKFFFLLHVTYSSFQNFLCMKKLRKVLLQVVSADQLETVGPQGEKHKTWDYVSKALIRNPTWPLHPRPCSEDRRLQGREQCGRRRSLRRQHMVPALYQAQAIEAHTGRTPQRAERWVRKRCIQGKSLWVSSWASQMEEEPAKELEKLKIRECHGERLRDGSSDGQ